MKSCSFLGCLWGRCQVWSPAGRHRETGHPLGWENSFYSMLAALSSASHGIPPFNPASSNLINFKPREPCFLLVLFNGKIGSRREKMVCVQLVVRSSQILCFCLFSPSEGSRGFGEGQAPACHLSLVLRCQGGFVCVTSGQTCSKEPTQARSTL